MNAVKGLYDNGTGHFTKKDAPNLEMARNPVHDANYHKAKTEIMKPLNEFLELLDNRTAQTVAVAEQAGRRLMRNLAQRSASAAKEIKEVIGDSVDKVDAGSRLVDEAGATMSQIVTSVKQVADIMSEIAAASHEQSDGISQVNQAITQMDEATQQNSALVEQAAAAAQSLQDQAAELARAVAVFKLMPGDAAASQPGFSSVPRAPQTATKPIAKAHVAKAPLKAIASTTTGGDWEEF